MYFKRDGPWDGDCCKTTAENIWKADVHWSIFGKGRILAAGWIPTNDSPSLLLLIPRLYSSWRGVVFKSWPRWMYSLFQIFSLILIWTALPRGVFDISGMVLLGNWPGWAKSLSAPNTSLSTFWDTMSSTSAREERVRLFFKRPASWSPGNRRLSVSWLLLTCST